MAGISGFEIFLYALFIASIVLILIFFYSYFRFKKHKQKEDLYSAITTIVIALIIISLNVIYIYPLATVDSVRYVAQIRTNETAIFILPIPEEQELINSLEIVDGNCEMEIVNTEYGKGLKILLDEKDFQVRIEGEYISHGEKINYDADLRESDNFLVYYEPEIGMNNTVCEIWYLRIIHQDQSDFHSKQIIVYDDLKPGWNSIKYEYYT